MADQDFALPVGHDENNLSTVALIIGRSFLQPVNIEDYNDNYAPGLEIWLQDIAEDKKLFASFNGIIKYIPSDNNNSFNKIELIITDSSVRRINSIRGLLEPAPKKVIYKNVNQDSVESALEIILNDGYQAALSNSNENSWHPVMRIEYNGQTIKEYLDDNLSDLSTAIAAIINGFITDDSILMVNSGQYIGDADTYSNLVDEIHENVAYTNPRLVLFETEEYAKNNLNPKYYFWRLLKNANHATQNRRRVNLITHTTLNANNEFDHPFLIALNINLDEMVSARSTLTYILPGQTTQTEDVLLFPIGKLSEWEGTNVNNNDPSDLQWQITDDNAVDFNIRRRPNTTSQDIQLCGETTGTFNACVDIESTTIPANTRTTIINRVQTIWTNFEDDIITVCHELQIPVEVIVSIIGHESQGGERAIRFEPLQQRHLDILIDSNVPNTVVNAYVNLTDPNGWGSITGVPSVPGDLDNAISPNNSTITWNQARDIIAVVPDRASPGIMQTLLETAIRRYNWLESWFDNIADTFDVVALPADDAERYDWLLTARHSILVGAATIKYSYCNFNAELDLVKLYSCYNAGSIRYQNNYWGLRFYDNNYVIDAGRHYNAFQNEIGNVTECRIRFWRNLE